MSVFYNLLDTHQHKSWRQTRRWSWWSSACSPCSPAPRSAPSGCSALQGPPWCIEFKLLANISSSWLPSSSTSSLKLPPSPSWSLRLLTCLVHSSLSLPSSIIGRSSLNKLYDIMRIFMMIFAMIFIMPMITIIIFLMTMMIFMMTINDDDDNGYNWSQFTKVFKMLLFKL